MDMYQFDSAALDALEECTIGNEASSHRKWYNVAKRITDIIFSLLAIILLSPVFLVTAIAIKLDSKGPVFFKQSRVCKDGKEFKMMKFRSMCADADKKLHELLQLNEKDGPIFKIQKDPRITKVGQIIRKFSIDELPQFFNVLLGDMSVVGPRPPLKSEVQQYSLYETQRLCVKPGLTCYWQISGRSDLSFKEWIELDIKYINESSISTDFKIILKTIPAVLFCKGAY